MSQGARVFCFIHYIEENMKIVSKKLGQVHNIYYFSKLTIRNLLWK